MLCMSFAACEKDGDGDDTSAPAGASSESATDTQAPVTEAETLGNEISYDLKNVRIVYGAMELGGTTGPYASTAAGTLYSTLKSLKLRDKPVDDSTADDGSKVEILVGSTNRGESDTVFSKMSEDNQFAVSFRKNKIVIHARKDISLDAAVKYFLNEYVPAAADGVLSVKENTTYIGTVQLVELSSVEAVNYKIVYAYGDKEVQSAANNIKGRIESRTKLNVTMSDDFETYSETDKLIVVGNVNAEKFPELETLKADVAFGECAIKVTENRIWLLGHMGETISDAAGLLVKLISDCSEVSNGVCTVAIPNDLSEFDDSYLSDYPEFSAGSFKEGLVLTDNELQLIYNSVTTADYEAYLNTLKADGYVSAREEHTIGNNRFMTLVAENRGQVHVAFYPNTKGTGELHLFLASWGEFVTLPNDVYDSATKVTETTFHVMSLDYNTGAYAVNKPITDGSGMSYVMTLEDGRFLIFDGGYTANDAENLWTYLQAVNRRADGKVTIAAWFVSHPHNDHFEACEKFVRAHYKDVVLQSFVVNAPTAERYGASNWSQKTLPGLAALCGADILKPHTGQVLKYCNTEIEIILTHENLMASAVQGDTNNTSTVVRIWEKGRSILLTGDASAASSSKMTSLYNTALKSDIFQVNHHGYSGGNSVFYSKVAPTYALYATSQDSFDGRIQGQGNSPEPASNQWIRDNVGIDHCYVADDTIEWITVAEDGTIVIEDSIYYVNSDQPVPDNAGVLQVRSPA